MEQEQCIWCGTSVADDDGWRALSPADGRRAVFCRLEHVVPWHIQARDWEVGDSEGPADVTTCAECGEPATVFLIRHRGEHRIPDGFCSAAHMADWAKSGGRFR